MGRQRAPDDLAAGHRPAVPPLLRQHVDEHQPAAALLVERGVLQRGRHPARIPHLQHHEPARPVHVEPDPVARGAHPARGRRRARVVREQVAHGGTGPARLGVPEVRGVLQHVGPGLRRRRSPGGLHRVRHQLADHQLGRLVQARQAPPRQQSPYVPARQRCGAGVDGKLQMVPFAGVSHAMFSGGVTNPVRAAGVPALAAPSPGRRLRLARRPRGRSTTFGSEVIAWPGHPLCSGCGSGGGHDRDAAEKIIERV